MSRLHSCALIALAALAPLRQDAGAPPAEEEGFANPELLVTTAWLAEHADDERLVVLDARGADDYAAGHIPGAVNLPLAATEDPEKRGMLGPRAQIARLLGERGIDAKTHVIVVDGGRSTAGPRVFWTLERYGHPTVSVLDGGLKKWRAEEREVTKEPTAVKAVKYESPERAARLATTEQVLAGLDDPDAVALDVRSTGEYEDGHLPGAVRLEWTQNFTDDEVPVLRSPAELRAMYAEQGITADKRVHCY